MCSEHGWLPYQLAKISLSFSLPVHDWMPPENGIVEGPSEATLTAGLINSFFSDFQWPLSAVSYLWLFCFLPKMKMKVQKENKKI